MLSDKMNYLVREYGYDIYVVTADQGSHPIPFPLDERIHVKDLNIRFHQQYRYNGFKRVLKYWELERLFGHRLESYIMEIRPDVISCIRDGYASTVLGLKGAFPVIFESHAMYRDVAFENSTLLHRLVTYWKRRKLRNLDKLVALTQGDADDWKRVCHHISVIPNVVHLNESGNYNRCESKKAIFEPAFQELVEQRNLNIVIHPAVPNIMEKYKESSMLLMSSLYEPFGLVLVEAMSCGLPVVAFNCPYGPSDIINDGTDGFLVEGRNVEAFANRVCQLMEDEDLRKQMGKAAILSAQRYNSDAIMPQWDRLFTHLTNLKK